MPHCNQLFVLTFCTCRCIVPIGLCYAGTLWVGNAAYLYLSVSFIQMLKVGAFEPLSVRALGRIRSSLF